MSAVTRWAATQRVCLALEQEEEHAQLRDKIASLPAKACEAAGLSVLALAIESTSTGLFGRCTVALVRADGRPFPHKAFKVGDEVVFYSPKRRDSSNSSSGGGGAKGERDDGVATGIVCRTGPTSFSVVCEEEVDEGRYDDAIRADLSCAEVTPPPQSSAQSSPYLAPI